MANSQVHSQIVKNFAAINKWYEEKTKNIPYPIYSSYDIRDSGCKIANVDANIFPAGFNNICPTDKETSVDLMGAYIDSHYGKDIRKIMLITEEHTNNPYYWENVATIKSLIERTGRDVLIAIPQPLEVPLKVQSSTGHELTVYSAIEGGCAWGDFNPQLIISNNDFSVAYEDWGKSVLEFPMNPPRQLGWYQRKKSSYFTHYNNFVDEFAKIAEIDPFLMRVETELFENFDIGSEESRKSLASRVDAMIARLREEYQKRGITREPFVFVKNNAGTYGLAVIRVGSGEEVLSWSYKSRKKMKAAKGGRDVEEVIIQEGIPSVVKADEATAEPVIYMIGKDLAGGFLRTHAEKDSTESLNSPGAVYKRLCVSDLAADVNGSPLENVYGWSAKLGVLAIGMEAKELGAEFKGYHL